VQSSRENIIDPMDSYDRFDASHEKRKEGDEQNQSKSVFVKVFNERGILLSAPGLLAIMLVRN